VFCPAAPERPRCELRVPRSYVTGRVVISGFVVEGGSLYQVVAFARLFKTRIKEVEYSFPCTFAGMANALSPVCVTNRTPIRMAALAGKGGYV
jgi:hypothetical protein